MKVGVMKDMKKHFCKSEKFEKVLRKAVRSVVKISGMAAVILIGSMTGLYDTRVETVFNIKPDSSDHSQGLDYGDAAAAITKSSMASGYKAKAMSVLRPDMPQAYYRAVVEIAGSFMCSEDKYHAIANIKEGEWKV